MSASNRKGANTSAAVRRAELVACPVCDADAGDPCVNDRGMRTGKPHAARFRLNVEAVVFAGVGRRPNRRR